MFMSQGFKDDLKQQERLQLHMKAKRVAADLKIPTSDIEVKKRLRSLRRPIALFGEGPAGRRDRLKNALAEIVASGEDLPEWDSSSSEPAKVSWEQINTGRPFWGPGCDELKEARMNILNYSIPKARERIAGQKRTRKQALLNPTKYRRTVEEATKELTNWTCHSSVIGDDRTLSSISLNMNQGQVAIGSWTSRVKLFDLGGQELATLIGHTERVVDVAWQPNAPTPLLASAGADKKVLLWKDREIVRELPGHKTRLGKICWHPVDNFLATSCFDRHWRLFDVNTGQCLLTQDGHSKEVYTVACHPDGSLWATGDLGGVIRVWDARTGQAIMGMEAHVDGVLALDFAPNGYQFASGARDNLVKIWDLRERQPSYTIPAHEKMVSSVKFDKRSNGASTFLATGSGDGSTKLWDARSFKLVTPMLANEKAVNAIAIAPDASVMVTASMDRTWKLWGHLDWKHVKVKDEPNDVEMKPPPDVKDIKPEKMKVEKKEDSEVLPDLDGSKKKLQEDIEIERPTHAAQQHFHWGDTSDLYK